MTVKKNTNKKFKNQRPSISIVIRNICFRDIGTMYVKEENQK